MYTTQQFTCTKLKLYVEIKIRLQLIFHAWLHKIWSECMNLSMCMRMCVSVYVLLSLNIMIEVSKMYA
jgi:hypothetical protein